MGTDHRVAISLYPGIEDTGHFCKKIWTFSNKGHQSQHIWTKMDTKPLFVIQFNSKGRKQAYVYFYALNCGILPPIHDWDIFQLKIWIPERNNFSVTLTDQLYLRFISQVYLIFNSQEIFRYI